MVLVVTCGLPHGAADHLYAGSLTGRPLGRAEAALFLCGYLAVSAVVVVGWIVMPLVTVVGFFLLSAWHFGQEDPDVSGHISERMPTTFRQVLRFATGGVVIWVLLLFRNREVVEILNMISPAETFGEIATAVQYLTPCAVAGLALAVINASLNIEDAAFASHGSRWEKIGPVMALASASVLAVLAGPLLGFVVYFCGWHSALGLARLRRELGLGWGGLVKTLAPLTAVTVLLFGCGAAFVWRSPDMTEALVRTTFLGLSAVAVPHILLHGAGPRLRRRLRAASPAIAVAGSAL
ncbi:MAG: Brp/Blh family beta-carotene 15,15'-dioxygenase [Planctomycetota bacterium]